MADQLSTGIPSFMPAPNSLGPGPDSITGGTNTYTTNQPETMIPMLDTDGNSGVVPKSQLKAALEAGGKIGVRMTAPDGSTGVIPVDRVQEAIKNGAQTGEQEPGYLQGLIDMGIKPIKELASQTYHSITDFGPDKDSPEYAAYQQQVQATEQKKKQVYHSAAAKFHQAMSKDDIGGIIGSAWELRKLFERAPGENPNDPILTVTDSALRGAEQEYAKTKDHVANVVSLVREALERKAYGDVAGAKQSLENISPELTQASGHGLATLLPLIGPAAANAGEDIGGGRTAYGLGEATALLGPSAIKGLNETGALKTAGTFINKATDAVTDRLPTVPSPFPNINPTSAARSAGQAVGSVAKAGIDRVIPIAKQFGAGVQESLADVVKENIQNLDTGSATDALDAIKNIRTKATAILTKAGTSADKTKIIVDDLVNNITSQGAEFVKKYKYQAPKGAGISNVFDPDNIINSTEAGSDIAQQFGPDVMKKISSAISDDIRGLKFSSAQEAAAARSRMVNKITNILVNKVPHKAADLAAGAVYAAEKTAGRVAEAAGTLEGKLPDNILDTAKTKARALVNGIIKLQFQGAGAGYELGYQGGAALKRGIGTGVSAAKDLAGTAVAKGVEGYDKGLETLHDLTAPKTPEQLIQNAGLVDVDARNAAKTGKPLSRMGEEFGKPMYQIEHAEHPGITAVMKAENMTSAKAVRDHMTGKLKAFGKPVPEDLQSIGIVDRAKNMVNKANEVAFNKAQGLVGSLKNFVERQESTAKIQSGTFSQMAEDLKGKLLANSSLDDEIDAINAKDPAARTVEDQQILNTYNFIKNVASIDPFKRMSWEEGRSPYTGEVITKAEAARRNAISAKNQSLWAEQEAEWQKMKETVAQNPVERNEIAQHEAAHAIILSKLGGKGRAQMINTIVEGGSPLAWEIDPKQGRPVLSGGAVTPTLDSTLNMSLVKTPADLLNKATYSMSGRAAEELLNPKTANKTHWSADIDALRTDLKTYFKEGILNEKTFNELVEAGTQHAKNIISNNKDPFNRVAQLFNDHATGDISPEEIQSAIEGKEITPPSGSAPERGGDPSLALIQDILGKHLASPESDVAEAARIYPEIADVATKGQMHGGSLEWLERKGRGFGFTGRMIAEQYDKPAMKVVQEVTDKLIHDITGERMRPEEAAKQIKNWVNDITDQLRHNSEEIVDNVSSKLPALSFKFSPETIQAVKDAMIDAPDMHHTFVNFINKHLAGEDLSWAQLKLIKVGFSTIDSTNKMQYATKLLDGEIVDQIAKYDRPGAKGLAAQYSHVATYNRALENFTQGELYKKLMTADPDIVFDRLIQATPDGYERVLEWIGDDQKEGTIQQGMLERMAEKATNKHGIDYERLADEVETNKEKFGDNYAKIRTVVAGLRRMSEDAKSTVSNTGAWGTFFAGTDIAAHILSIMAGAPPIHILTELGIEVGAAYVGRWLLKTAMKPSGFADLNFIERAFQRYGPPYSMPDKVKNLVTTKANMLWDDLKDSAGKNAAKYASRAVTGAAANKAANQLGKQLKLF